MNYKKRALLSIIFLGIALISKHAIAMTEPDEHEVQLEAGRKKTVLLKELQKNPADNFSVLTILFNNNPALPKISVTDFLRKLYDLKVPADVLQSIINEGFTDTNVKKVFDRFDEGHSLPVTKEVCLSIIKAFGYVYTSEWSADLLSALKISKITPLAYEDKLKSEFKMHSSVIKECRESDFNEAFISYNERAFTNSTQHELFENYIKFLRILYDNSKLPQKLIQLVHQKNIPCAEYYSYLDSIGFSRARIAALQASDFTHEEKLKLDILLSNKSSFTRHLFASPVLTGAGVLGVFGIVVCCVWYFYNKKTIKNTIKALEDFKSNLSDQASIHKFNTHIGKLALVSSEQKQKIKQSLINKDIQQCKIIIDQELACLHVRYKKFLF